MEEFESKQALALDLKTGPSVIIKGRRQQSMVTQESYWPLITPTSLRLYNKEHNECIRIERIGVYVKQRNFAVSGE
jgi:hypothetical protein